jgi:hypothetical protein
MTLSRIDRERIKEHAAPEAVLAMMEERRVKRAKLDRELRWLEDLLVARCREVQEGSWP